VSIKRLGKGLEALIRPEKDPIVESSIANLSGVLEIALKDINPNPNQPRRYFDEEKLAELVQSIKAKGILTPITIRKNKTGYEIIAGERRWRASKKAGKIYIPAYILEVEKDSDMMELALIENIQRENLNPLEESEAYAVLNSTFNMSHESIAKSVGKKRATISNSLRLLRLPVNIRKSLRIGDISAGHARAILQAKTIKSMNRIWNIVLSKNLSVRGAELLVKEQNVDRAKQREKKEPFFNSLTAIQNTLIEVLGTKVKIKPGKKGGLLEISYFSDDDLDRLIDLMKKKD
jgi:ParB family chromosome partitioning protein|tara:strand:- start:8263 stop:9135 length:873 start_codon:yes stop_codon:yes gene_type:complete